MTLFHISYILPDVNMSPMCGSMGSYCWTIKNLLLSGNPSCSVTQLTGKNVSPVNSQGKNCMENDGINADPLELEKFSQLAHRWWDPQSEFKPLHEINPLRLNFIDEMAGL